MTSDKRNVFSVSVFVVKGGDPERGWDSVLLCRHRRFPDAGWLPVGGEIEPNETPLQAAIRETYEETGIALVPAAFPSLADAPPGAPPGLLGFEEHSAGIKNGHKVEHLNFIFVAVAPPNAKILCCEEHSELEWRSRPKGIDFPFCNSNVTWCLTRWIWKGAAS